MNNIRFDIRLRPIRFGFLVRPDDSEKALEIFRINTCLWGGMFNPIIPFFENVPPWLKDVGFRFEDAKQMINDYLDFFEPDFLVEAEEGLANGFGYDPKRVLQLERILELPGGRNVHRYGLSVHGLYLDLYEKAFQFEQRHKYNVVHVKPTDATFTNFAAANFGSFPTQEQFRYFEQNYETIFNPKHVVELDSTVIRELYMHMHNFDSALTIGRAKIRVQYNAPLLSTLFILDLHESKDLIDFWNLRAIHEHVVAIPIQWIEELSPFCKQFIRDNYRRQPDDPGPNMVGPVLMFSRTLSDTDTEEIEKKLSFTDEGDVYTTQKWVPTICYKLSVFKVASPTRPTLEADRKIMNIQIDETNPEIQFDPLFPDFANQYYNLYRVANVVRLQDWSSAPQHVRLRYRSYNDQIATVFPCNYKNPSVPKFPPEADREWEFILPTTEGLVIFPYDEQMFERWNLVDGTTTVNQWFNDNQVTATRSDAGKTTEQIIQTLGSLRGVSYLANEDVVKLLNGMVNDDTKTAHYLEFRNKIHNAINYEELRKRTFETLIERKAVELGLELRCSKCSNWSWYSVNQLDYSLTCDFCRKQYDFPVTNPAPSYCSRWAYRVVGPFALPAYAKGGYAASLAMRFFADVIGGFDRAELTWSSAQKIELSTDKEVEADFILWYRRKEIFGMGRQFLRSVRPIFGTAHPTETVFGEAKSFGKDVFKQDDVNNMKWLAEAFPGSILVFATMKEELSQEEIDRIKSLAYWGRGYDKERKQTRAPVIILTGTELFTTGSLQRAWEKKDGVHKDLAKKTSWETEPNIRVLADLTQYLYLGMQPYGLHMIGSLLR